MKFKAFPNETQGGKVGRYKHLYSCHCIGAISRLDRSKLVVFAGN